MLYGHSYALSMGVNGSEDPVSLRLIAYWGESLPSLAVDLFFVASGFLVTASYCQRNDFYAFTEARLLRIFPGLIVAVLLCVFVVGPISTTASLSDYFASPSTFSYFKHNVFLLNGIQFDLPSVFTSNPYPGSVNGSLWTLPIEFWMYVFVAVLGGCVQFFRIGGFITLLCLVLLRGILNPLVDYLFLKSLDLLSLVFCLLWEGFIL